VEVFCQRHHKVVFFARGGLGIPTEKVRTTKRIYPFDSMRDRAFVFDSTFVSHQSDEENALSLYESYAKNDDFPTTTTFYHILFTTFVLSLSLSQKRTDQLHA